MAKPSNGSTGKGGKDNTDDGGSGGKSRNQAPVVENNQTLYFNEDGTVDQNQYVIASDPEDGVLTYSLIDDYNGLFSIDSSTGQISINNPDSLDYDLGTTSYDLSVTVIDDAKKAGTTTTTVRIELVDVNDNTPEFAPNQTTSFTADENQTNIVIGTVSATDLDVSTEFNTVTYSLSGTYASHFEIDQNGTITLIQPLDYEEVSSLDLIVTASDGELSSQQIVTVNVNDLADNNLYPMILSSEGSLIGTEDVWTGEFNQFSPYTISVGDADNPAGNYVFDLSVTNIPGSVQLTSYVHGDVYSSEGATFNINLFEDTAFESFELQGTISYQGLDTQGNSYFDISINQVSGFDSYAQTLYDGNGLNTDPWYSHDTGSFSESYWNPVDFGLSLNWTISQYEGENLIESADLLSTLNILDTDSDLEDLLVFSEDTLIGASKPDISSDPIHVSAGEIITLEFFDTDASALVLEELLDIQPELVIAGEAPLVNLGNDQYEVLADVGTHNLTVNMTHEGLIETFDIQLVVDS
ncbi:MAG: cadherin repeat domain-containing protein [Neptuniibacter sp.]